MRMYVYVYICTQCTHTDSTNLYIYIQFYTHIHITYMPGCIWGDAVAACELRVAGCRVLVGA